ncbi:hypothetical protein [Amycolatopsis pigmentata]|uniref:Uncharacterized protein n=1 Tax=Amycolatopsis pigmentata TaxID=450801 RepID=A0ABW5G9B5_9PSEU
MSAQERLRRAVEAIESAAREQHERRELTERKLIETEAKAKAAFRKEVDAAVRYAGHMEELARREKEAGGWATGKTLSDNENVMGFEVEEDHRPVEVPFAGAADRTESTAAPLPRRRRRRDDVDDDEDFSTTNWLD